MAGKVGYIKVCSPLKLRSGLIGKNHAICHYSYNLPSALGSIMGAPRIMQAVAKDRIAPAFFSKGVGASNEPCNALLLTFIIAQTGILIGDLNTIARIVTIFFIITYGFLNITYTVES
jgi:amino acid transporter